jgi:hypothetical protein
MADSFHYPPMLLVGIVVFGIIPSQILWNVQELQATTVGAFQVCELVAHPEHHLACDVRAVPNAVLANSTDVHEMINFDLSIRLYAT